MKYKAAVLTVSDKCSRGEREDTSGPALCEMLAQAGFDVAWTGVVPDEKEQIGAALKPSADKFAGLSGRDRAIAALTARNNG